MGKVKFDFTDADLLMDVKLRTKKLEGYYRILSIPKDRDFVFIHLAELGIREVSYEQLQQRFEYYNKTMRQWMPCEKVG